MTSEIVLNSSDGLCELNSLTSERTRATEGAEEKKQRALRELRFEKEPNDYRAVYDELVQLLTEQLADLNQYVECWK